MLLKAGSKVMVRAVGVARLENPDLTMDEAEAKLLALGNKILERDDAKRTFKVLDVEREQVLTQDTEVPDVPAGTPGAA